MRLLLLLELELLLRLLLLLELELLLELRLRRSSRVGRLIRTLLLLLLLLLELELALRLPRDDLPVCTQLSTSVRDHDGSILSYPFQLILTVLVLKVPSLSGSCTAPLHNLSDFPVFDVVVMIYGKVFEKYFHLAVPRSLLGVYL